MKGQFGRQKQRRTREKSFFFSSLFFLHIGWGDGWLTDDQEKCIEFVWEQRKTA